MEENIIPFRHRQSSMVRLAEIVSATQMPQPLRIVENECPVCKNRGWLRRDLPLGHPEFGKLVRCQCNASGGTQRTKDHTYRWLQTDDELVQTLMAMTFASFVPSYQRAAYAASRDWASKVQAQPTNQPNVLFAGNWGTGKTHLAAAILNELHDGGIACLFVTAPDLFDALYAAHFEDKERIIAQAASVQVLCLDDLDKLHVKEDGTYQKDMLFKLLNKRYLAHKPTIITTNARGDLDKWLDRAVISRLFGNMLPIKVDGQDYRQIAARGR